MRKVLIVALAFSLAGCARKGPVVSHGQPVDPWVAQLKSPDAKARKKAVVALGHAGPADPAAVPALAGAVKDADPAVRAQAILAILNIGPQAKEALPALEEAQK